MLQSVPDAPAGVLPALARSTWDLRRPPVALGSPEWQVLCLGNKPICFQELGSARCTRTHPTACLRTGHCRVSSGSALKVSTGHSSYTYRSPFTGTEAPPSSKGGGGTGRDPVNDRTEPTQHITWISVHYIAEFHRPDHRFVPDLLLSALINQHLEQHMRILQKFF